VSDDPGRRAEIGIIGGSGIRSFVEDARPVETGTPFGPPSEPPLIGTVAGRRVAFLPRHGHDHRYPPHRVPYRANLWALRELGVRQVLAPSAVGALRADLTPGTLVVPDQVVDRTWGRPHTVWDAEGPVVHVSLADPYCPRGRAAAVASAGVQGGPERVVGAGTLVVVNGPRFSTRAESRWHAGLGGDVVGMTGMPEAALARELALCFTCLALVTDADAGVEGGSFTGGEADSSTGDGGAPSAVSHAEVLEAVRRNAGRMTAFVRAVVAALPAEDGPDGPDCSCRHALDGLPLPFPLP
jgi:5'-methylthioadenosine phosphorylase